MPTTPITPHAHEDEAEFAERAHHALAADLPDADERTSAVFDAWREARGESDEEKAAHAKFPDDEYAHIQNVPVFMEHDYPRYLLERDGKPKLDADGRQIQVIEKYDLEALKSICANLNYRIRNTKDFSPISDKHSPRKGSEESKPRLFGFSGPYGLGQVGNEDTKWAIVAKQEHWFKDKAHLAREYPRRSPEVYLGRPMADRILDPITALGADTPALDMGIHYAEDESSGELMAMYSGPPLTATYAFDETKHPRDAGKFAHAHSLAAKKATDATPESHQDMHRSHEYARHAAANSAVDNHESAAERHHEAAEAHQALGDIAEHLDRDKDAQAHADAHHAHMDAAKAHRHEHLFKKLTAEGHDVSPWRDDITGLRAYHEATKDNKPTSEKDHTAALAKNKLDSDHERRTGEMRSEYEAAAFPGGGNTFVPAPMGEDDRKKKTYALAPPLPGAAPAAPVAPPAPAAPPAAGAAPNPALPPATGSPSMISPEDANTIIQALMETEPMQWVVGQMQAAKAPTGDQTGAEQPGAPPAAAPPGAPPGAPPDAGMGTPAAPDTAPGAPSEFPPQKQQMTEETSPDLKEFPSRPGDDADGDQDQPSAKKEHTMPDVPAQKKEETANYTQRELERADTAKYAALETEINELKAKNAATEKQALVSERHSMIRAYRLEGFDIDETAEVERCSLDNMPTQAEFERHMETIAKYAGRIPLNVNLHTPDQPLHEDRQRADARRAARAGNSQATSDPPFVNDPDFLDEVATAAYDLQSQPTWSPSQGSVYKTARQQVIDRRRASQTGAVAKVG